MKHIGISRKLTNPEKVVGDLKESYVRPINRDYSSSRSAFMFLIGSKHKLQNCLHGGDIA